MSIDIVQNALVLYKNEQKRCIKIVKDALYVLLLIRMQ